MAGFLGAGLRSEGERPLGRAEPAGAGRARAERDVTVADGKSNVERRAGRLEEEVGRQSSGEHGGG